MIRFNKILIIFILGILLVSCATNRVQPSFIGKWKESDLDFSKSICFQKENDLLGIITSVKWCCGSSEDYIWLRKGQNLLMTFNILKKIGFKRVISDAQYRKKLFENEYWDYDWEELSLNDIVQKMISSYDQSSDTTDYFYKFWNRRKAENNNETVLKILKEIDQIYNFDFTSKVEEENMDQKLYTLIKYNVEFNESDSISKCQITLNYFNYLKKIDLEHSAYNLIFELKETAHLKINKDSLLKTLSFDTIPEDSYWQTRNDAKWIKSYHDNGP